MATSILAQSDDGKGPQDLETIMRRIAARIDQGEPVQADAPLAALPSPAPDIEEALRSLLRAVPGLAALSASLMFDDGHIERVTLQD